MRALIIIDIQNDFCAGGTLEVPNGDQIIPLVNDLAGQFDLVVATQDWHPPTHKSFASNHRGKQPFEVITLGGLEQVLWPDHCVQGTRGAEFHPQLDIRPVEAVFRKGMDPEIDSYSGFYDNGRKKSTGLTGYLRERKVEEVYVCGLAADYCVYFTARDAVQSGFRTHYIEDATRAISADQFDAAREELAALGVVLLDSGRLLSPKSSRV